MRSSFNERRYIGLVHEGVLRIDAAGRVWRKKRRVPGNVWKDVVPYRAEFTDSNGYLRLSKAHGHPYQVLAHRLVWQWFKGDIPDNCEINHKNGNPHDNRPDNLEAVSHLDNIRHARRELGWDPSMQGERHPGAKITAEDVVAMRALYRQGYKTMDIADRFGLARSQTRRICLGLAWRHVVDA